MSAFALVTGVLFKPAEEKTSSKTGRVFVSATLKVGGETGDAEFWSITAAEGDRARHECARSSDRCAGLRDGVRRGQARHR
jgi:hypothetical protein